MGTLVKADTEQEYALAARCVIGRSPLGWIRLEHSSVSREHAVIEWNEGVWRVRDLGSRNGTTINGKTCSSGYHVLALGDSLAFGDAAESWRLGNVDIPPPAAVSREGAMRLGRGDLLVLPDDDSPAVSVQWGGHSWIVDDGDSEAEVQNGDALEIGGQSFELLLPSSNRLTTMKSSAGPSVADVTAVFEFNRSEEFIRLILRRDGHDVSMPERAFSELLLVLARIRAHDSAVRGLSEAEAGWLETGKLADKLKFRAEKINLDVFRARRQLSDYGFIDAARIVERRKQHHQMRFGITNIVFVPL